MNNMKKYNGIHAKMHKKTDSQKTVRMGFYYAANLRASQPSRHIFIVAQLQIL